MTKEKSDAVVTITPGPTPFIDTTTDDYITRIRVSTVVTKAREEVKYYPEILHKHEDGGDNWRRVGRSDYFWWRLSDFEKAAIKYPEDTEGLARAKHAIDMELKYLNSKRVVSVKETYIKHP